MISASVTALRPWAEAVEIYFAFLENGIEYEGKTIDFVLRKFLPNAQGIRSDNWQKGDTKSWEISWDDDSPIPPSIVNNPDAVYAIVFIQDPVSGAILQAAKEGDATNYYIPIVTHQASSINNDGVTIYPNPAQDKLWIQHSGIHRGLTLQLRNLQGQAVNRVKVPSHEVSHEWNLSGIVPGVYILEVLDEKNVLKREKIVISNY